MEMQKSHTAQRDERVGFRIRTRKEAQPFGENGMWHAVCVCVCGLIG
ncbi:MAG: hypothetical protein ACI85Q_002171, partial [Salibacteraceae bacterium]